MMNKTTSNISLNKIYEIREITEMPDSIKSKEILKKLVHVTANILTQRKWKIKVLCEFYPSNQSLFGMNVNNGESIMIRLRSPHDKTIFLEWDYILGTMCHELAHMAIGPHNTAFYNLCDELHDEADKSENSTYFNPTVKNNLNSITNSNSFTSNGIKLGGKSTLNHKTSAANAALKRLKISEITNNSGQKLGGTVIKSSDQLKKLRVQATEQRMQNNIKTNIIKK